MRALVWLCVLPLTARAQDLPARLSVEQGPSAEQCASRAELERRVESILHRHWADDAGAQALDLAIDVRFERAADSAFVARVSASGPKPGQRVLRDGSPTCDALSEAVSVAIALLVDDALASSSPSATTPAAATVVKPTPSNADAPASTATRPRANVWRARAAVEAGAGYGLGGAGAPVGFGWLGARAAGVVLELGGGGSWPSSTTFDGGSVRTSLLFGSARVCYELGHAFTIAPCALVAVGRLHGSGTGYGQLATSSLPWTAGGLGLVAQERLSGALFVSLGGTLWVPTRRQTFSVENAGIAWESKPLAAALSAGLGVELF